MHQRITSRAKADLGTCTPWPLAVEAPLDFPPSASESTQKSHKAAQKTQRAMHSFSERDGNRAKSMGFTLIFYQS
jgi:hypothetical protein